MKIRNQPANNLNSTPGTGDWHLLIRMVTLTGLLVFTVMPLMSNAASTASATGQASLQGVNTWSSRGPWGGYIYNLAIAPSNPDILYAWTEDNLFKSTDGGSSWNHAYTTTTKPRSSSNRSK